jgi:MoxR-like ATPase
MILAGKIIALLDGRYSVAFDDIRAAATSALRHRLILNFEAQAEGLTSDHLISEILKIVVPEKVA